jgi:hypothetical protein
MSDFLTSLAARSTGSAETIQPRVPALFEPQGVRNQLPAAPEFAAVEQERADEPDLRSDVQPPVSPQPLAVMPAARPEAAKHPNAPAAELSPAPDRQTTSQNPSPAPLMTVPKSAEVPKAELTPAPLISPHPLIREAAQIPVAGPALPWLSPSEAAKPVTSRPEPSAEREQTEHPPVSRKETSPPVATQPVRPANTIVGPRVTPRIEGRRPAAAPSPAKSPETVIHVTIGRIEVRATAETAPTRKTHAAAPVTGLDEYLRSRAKRGNA